MYLNLLMKELSNEIRSLLERSKETPYDAALTDDISLSFERTESLLKMRISGKSEKLLNGHNLMLIYVSLDKRIQCEPVVTYSSENLNETLDTIMSIESYNDMSFIDCIKTIIQRGGQKC